ncbi:MAG TPA: DotU family type IV/VI secretion system protein [Pyrinomonadaceae bacterium]|nr:DotU family type IV/VI secretion system protein [Pyrinomonadaceae bacterium]
MSVIAHNESYLYSQFREFYTEVIRLKQLVQTRGWVCPEEPANGNGHPGAGTWVYFPEVDRLAATARSPQSLTVRDAPVGLAELDYPEHPPSSEQTKLTLLVWRSLIALFRRNAIQVLRHGGAQTDHHFEALYIMAAFADEVFINMEWEGQRTWPSNLIESALFHTHVAGEMFFEKLDRLLAARDPSNKSLAAIYLNILSLGFQGKYRSQPDAGRLRQYRHDLFNFIFQQPADLELESKVAFPDAYVKTLRSEKKKLTNPALWLGVLGLVFVGYLLISQGVWLMLTNRLNAEITTVENLLPKH